MKKITLIIFTFSGIYAGFAQNPASVLDSGNAQKNDLLIDMPCIKDSLRIKAKPSVRLYPNPAKNNIEIEIRGFDPGYVQVQLINIKGKPVKTEKRIVIQGNEIIVFMFSEKPGMYLLMLKQGEENVKTNLLIQ